MFKLYFVSFSEFAEPTRTDFSHFRVNAERTLSREEQCVIHRVLAYVFQTRLSDEELMPPTVTRVGTIMEYEYDSTVRRRTDRAPYYDLIFAEALKYIRNGTPIRRNNRDGEGTKGTRLVEGIGRIVIEFTVR